MAEAVEAVEREASAVTDKFHTFSNRSAEALAQRMKELAAARDELLQQGASNNASINPASALMLLSTLRSVKDSVSKLCSDHRDLHSSVSKVGKTIDKHFVPDYDSTTREELMSAPKHQRMLNEVVLQHLYRQGRLEVADTLAHEAGLAEDIDEDDNVAKEAFREMNSIVSSLRAHDLGPALAWVSAHRNELDERGQSVIVGRTVRAGGHVLAERRSLLELRLHRLRFVQLLASGDAFAAVTYAKVHFPRFAHHGHLKEISELMCATLYPGPLLAKSPYGPRLLDPTLWDEIADLFVKDACALMGLSVESPLTVALNAGCKAVPALLNIKQVMQQRQVAGVWATSAREELPIEIDLGADCRFHSIFACPILRQQTTDINPPIRLTCGHCISKDALHKLSSGNKLKCPYCPVEQSPHDARQITF